MAEILDLSETLHVLQCALDGGYWHAEDLREWAERQRGAFVHPSVWILRLAAAPDADFCHMVLAEGALEEGALLGIPGLSPSLTCGFALLAYLEGKRTWEKTIQTVFEQSDAHDFGEGMSWVGSQDPSTAPSSGALEESLDGAVGNARSWLDQLA